MVNKALVSRNSVPGPKFPLRACDKTPFRGRKTFVSHSEIVILADDLPYSKRLPRLVESLAESTRGAAQSQQSEVVFNSTRDLLPRSWLWMPEHRRYSHPLRFILTPSAKELGITFRTGIGITYVTTIRNRHSETVDSTLVLWNSLPVAKFPPERVYYYSDCRTLRSDSLDYVNRWRSPHAQLPSHNDQKSCSTRREISCPAKELGITFRTGIGIAYVTTIRNWHSEMVDSALVSRNSRLPRLRESLAEPTRGAAQSQRLDVVFNSARDLHPRSWIWMHEHRRYSHPLRFIPTPSLKELGITFRPSIGIAYVTTIQNRHSETVDRALISSASLDYANCRRGQHPESVYHCDRKSCSNRLEISTPGRGYGCTNIADIVTPSGLFPPLHRKNRA
ncbi:hypothetical protein Taro_007522 [Colocasia esculenta]|uniref:Uncharacterized protein n=1 Tax=Colocasia esculenta TaxID=4460 RepID=A0A843TZ60_COLES|nr:hypothetical protein [Colocasia esculenta]